MENILPQDSLSTNLPPLDPLSNGYFTSSSFGSLDPLFPATPFHFPTISPSSPSDNETNSTISSDPVSSSSPSPDDSPTTTHGRVESCKNRNFKNGPFRETTMASVKSLSFDEDESLLAQSPNFPQHQMNMNRKQKQKRTSRNKLMNGTTPKKVRASKKPNGTKRKRTNKSVSPSPPSSPATSPEHFKECDPVALSSIQLRELMQDAALKKQRLQRKAELARISRQKKQLKMGELENQVRMLEEENRQLKAKLAACREQKQPNDASISQGNQQEETKNLEKVVELPNLITIQPISVSSSSLSSSTMTGMMETQRQGEEAAILVGNLAKAFQEQASNLESALKVIEQALVPCTAIQFLEWSLIQKEKFYSDDGLFMSLFRDEMGATQQQIAQVLALRPQMQQQASKLKIQSLIDTFRAFESLFRPKGLQQQESFNLLRTIFTPNQLAAYFKWVSLYGAVLIKVPV